MLARQTRDKLHDLEEELFNRCPQFSRVEIDRRLDRFVKEAKFFVSKILEIFVAFVELQKEGEGEKKKGAVKLLSVLVYYKAAAGDKPRLD